MVAVKVGTAAACMQMSRPLVQYTPPLSPLSPRRREAAATPAPFSPLSPHRRTAAAAASAVTEFDRVLAGRMFLGARAASLPRPTRPLRSVRLVRRAFSAQSFFPYGGAEGDQDGDLAEQLWQLPSRFEEENGGGESVVEGDGAVTEARSASWQPPSASASSSPAGPGPLKKSGSSVDVAPPQWLGIVRDPPSWRPEIAQAGLGDADAASARKPPRREDPDSKPQKLPPQQVQRHHDNGDEKQRAAATLSALWGWEEGLKEAGETACCSVRRAFSSLVFIIRELHTHTLQLRELLFYEDLRGILAQAQKETHASFCWLFQQIFSCTPTLMVSLMLLLANYTAHSMALAAAPPVLPPAAAVVVEYDAGTAETQRPGPGLDLSSAMRTFTITTKGAGISGGAASVGGGGGGGNRLRPVAGATDDWHSPSRQHARLLPDGGGVMDSPAPAQEDQLHRDEQHGAPSSVGMDEEARAWRRIEEEAARMQAAARHDALTDRETLLRLVAPVAVQLEGDRHYTELVRTELAYQEALGQEPSNPLLLANFAQFLFVVAHDYRRAEHYFKRAVSVKPADAEALNRYASFLWLAKQDLCGAEETYLEAIDAEPGNPCYAANYAHFLFSTGCDDLCFPLGQDGGGAGFEADEVDEEG